MTDRMTNEQFTKVLDILEKSIEEIIRNTEDKEEMIEKIKELLNSNSKLETELRGSRSPLFLYTYYRG